MTATVITPDFADHRWVAVSGVAVEPPIVTVHWPDGASLSCDAVWLYETTRAIDPLTREGTIDPGDLPGPDFLDGAERREDGALLLRWADGVSSAVHPGWLRHVADGDHLPDASIGDPEAASIVRHLPIAS